MSYKMQYPIICMTEEDLDDVTPFIDDQFYNNNSYHFNAVEHLDENCSQGKYAMKMGENVNFKVIYVAPHLKKNAWI